MFWPLDIQKYLRFTGMVWWVVVNGGRTSTVPWVMKGWLIAHSPVHAPRRPPCDIISDTQTQTGTREEARLG
jgi:hypothetical protein